MNVVEVQRGDSPLILGFPHTGTDLPPEVWEKLNENGRLLADTDWHLHTLYAGLRDATTVRATFHRYVIDANRDPVGTSLYPGQNTTGLAPTTDFDGKPIWRENHEPMAQDVAARLAGFHAPYHAALTAEVERTKSAFGYAVLYDCHSIRSNIPFLFAGKLPDFNIGTDHGRTCSEQIETIAWNAVQAARGFTSVLNGRFKGGWTVRHYGRPTVNVHAIQMELAQSTYLAAEEQPYQYDPEKARAIRVHLAGLLDRIVDETLKTRLGNKWA